MPKRVIWTREMTRSLIHGRVNGISYVEMSEIIGVNLHGIIAKCTELGFLPRGNPGRPALPDEVKAHIAKLLRQGLTGPVIKERTGISTATISRIRGEMHWKWKEKK